MAEKARPIKADRLLNRYSGYRHNRTVTEDPELTHVGPGTPCGEYLRRFWQPIEFSAEVNDLPKRIKILDEELVLFRDRSGHVGPGTPCGEYLRRFWQPIEFSAEVNDLPKRIKILDEELVLFRDRSGHVGLLDW